MGELGVLAVCACVLLALFLAGMVCAYFARGRSANAEFALERDRRQRAEHDLEATRDEFERELARVRARAKGARDDVAALRDLAQALADPDPDDGWERVRSRFPRRAPAGGVAAAAASQPAGAADAGGSRRVEGGGTNGVGPAIRRVG